MALLSGKPIRSTDIKTGDVQDLVTKCRENIGEWLVTEQPDNYDEFSTINMSVVFLLREKQAKLARIKYVGPGRLCCVCRIKNDHGIEMVRFPFSHGTAGRPYVHMRVRQCMGIGCISMMEEIP